jgi:hypothetical protein
VPILERTDFIQMHIDVFMGTMMSTGNKVALLGFPESKRNHVIRQAREKLRQRVLEDKVWQWLLGLDNLTINGTVVWQEYRPPRRVQNGKRKKR